MKRIIFLAVLLTGIAWITRAEANVRQENTPEVPCFDSYQVQYGHAVAVPDVVVAADIPECATVPVLVVDVTAVCDGYIWNITKPPELSIGSAQANLLNSYFPGTHDWMTQRSHLAKKFSFLKTAVRNLPVPFD